VPLEVEHIVPKSRGGTDRVSNLTIACRNCNLKKGDKTAKECGYPDIQQQAKKSLKAAACINNIRWRLVEHLGAENTYGYVTKYERNKLGLEKSHVNDAFVIAGGTNQEAAVLTRSFKSDVTIVRYRRIERDLSRQLGDNGTCCNPMM
jgi:hypothetical protein